MNKFIIIATLLSLFFTLKTHAQTLPEKDSVLSQMILANKYFMDKWPDPGEDIVTDKVRPSNIWTRSTYYEGLMALYYTYHDTNYYQYSVDWGESHEWKLANGQTFYTNADYQCCGQTYIELYQLDNKPERIETIKFCIDQVIGMENYSHWSWVDAMQMAMPVYAKLGVVLNDTSYFNAMNKFYMYTRDHHGDSGLYNDQQHLWWRDKDFDPPFTTPSGLNQYWSRGNGWVIAALARVLEVLPDTCKYRDEYITTLQEMSDTLIKIQRYDGFWNPSLVDSLDYGGKETSGTAFFTYGIAWGINHGILDEATYKPAVVKAWNGMIKDALHPNGFLGWVQGTGKQPSDGQPLSYDKEPNFEDYALGAFLLAGSEVIKLAPGELSQTKPANDYYYINTSVTGQGTVETSADSVLKYSNVVLTAVPAEGWRFVSWEGAAGIYDNPVTINVLSDITVTANFEKTPSILTIQENGPGFCGVDGTIDSDWDGYTGDGFANTSNLAGMGIDYQVRFAQSGSYTFIFKYAANSNRPAKMLLDDTELFDIYFPSTVYWNAWDSVSTTATVEEGNYTLRLEGTSSSGLGNIDYLTIEGDTAFAATCQYTLSVNTTGEGNVSDVSGTYDAGSSVEITATPNTDWSFDNWSGDAGGNANPLTVIMDADKTITANFSIINSISVNPEKEIKIYPSVVNDEIFISLPGKMEGITYVNIMDVTGKIYLKEYLSDTDNTIDISNLKPGIYFVRVASQDCTKTSKIIVK